MASIKLAICNDFHTSPIQLVEILKIHVADEHVGSHSGTSFTADSGHHARSRNPADPAPLPLQKLHGGGKKISSGPPHLHVRCDKGSGRRRRRSNNTRKHCGSIRNNLSVGQLVKGAAARGHPCERNRACSGSVIVGINLESCLTLIETSRCHHDGVGPPHDGQRTGSVCQFRPRWKFDVHGVCQCTSLDVVKARD